MKYIRTKNGIFKNRKHNYPITEKEIIAQADTIEELCDEFVCEKEIIHYNYQLKSVHYDIYNECAYCSLEKWMKTHNTIYGAIWTDKGLIYVAKMNEKGEMELL